MLGIVREKELKIMALLNFYKTNLCSKNIIH